MKGGGDGEWYLTGAGDCADESALINDGTTHAPAGGVACAPPAHQPTVPHVQRTSAQPALRALIISSGARHTRQDTQLHFQKQKPQQNLQFLKAAHRNLNLFGITLIQIVGPATHSSPTESWYSFSNGKLVLNPKQIIEKTWNLRN